MAETSPAAPRRIPVIDSAIPELAKINGLRPLGVSRYEYLRNHDAVLVPDKRGSAFKAEDEKRYLDTFGNFLQLAIETTRIEKEDGFPTRNDLSTVYDMGLKAGLSRYDLEQLAAHEIEWLRFCINPFSNLPQHSVSNSGHVVA